MSEALKINDNIYWVGSKDRDIRVFDIVMYTDFGTTYNSFILKTSTSTILFEISKEKFFEQFIKRLQSVCDIKTIDYVVVNHTEPDHTGSLVKLLEINPSLKIISTAVAYKFLKEITNINFESIIVKDKEKIKIGDKTLNFIIAPFLHWPDSMFTYVEEEKTLFSCDFLGAHYCSDLMFDDKIIKSEFYEDYKVSFKYYYDCIMSPFKSNVLDAIQKIENIDIQTVCTGHGPILQQNISKSIELYKKWSTNSKNENPVVVIPYVTSYGYTKMIAQKIKEGIQSIGQIKVYEYDLVTDSKEEVLEKIKNADGLVVGSPTILSDALPPIWDVISRLNPIINKGLVCCVFGSYGWSGEAVTNIEARLKQLKFDIPLKGLRVIFKPNEADFQNAYEFGQKFGQEVMAKF